MTSFARKPYTKPPRTPMVRSSLATSAAVMRHVVDRASVPVPKRAYIRSTALLEACRELACQHCGVMDGMVCAAHSNWGTHGKGKAVKADDNRVAALCAKHHLSIDQGSFLAEPARKSLWWRAHKKTVWALQDRGLWPHGVPVPDVLVCPF